MRIISLRDASSGYHNLELDEMSWYLMILYSNLADAYMPNDNVVLYQQGTCSRGKGMMSSNNYQMIFTLQMTDLF